MTGTALLAGEALADSEILSYVLKVSFKRARPHTLSPAKIIGTRGSRAPVLF